MKTLNEYMSMSYKMEIIEDQDEGGFVISYLIYQVVLHVEKR